MLSQVRTQETKKIYKVYLLKLKMKKEMVFCSVLILLIVSFNIIYAAELPSPPPTPANPNDSRTPAVFQNEEEGTNIPLVYILCAFVLIVIISLIIWLLLRRSKKNDNSKKK